VLSAKEHKMSRNSYGLDTNQTEPVNGTAAHSDFRKTSGTILLYIRPGESQLNIPKPDYAPPMAVQLLSVGGMLRVVYLNPKTGRSLGLNPKTIPVQP